MDFEIAEFDGEKLVEIPDDVGVDSEQLTAQQSWLADACVVLSLLFALSQHFIIPSFGECKGVPATTPVASAKNKNNNVNRFNILNDYMFWS